MMARRFQRMQEDGRVYTHRGFVSGSLDPLFAKERAEEYGQPLVLEIIPKQALFLSSISMHDTGAHEWQYELECLIQHYGQFRIVDVLRDVEYDEVEQKLITVQMVQV